jgi:uncharacterized protein
MRIMNDLDRRINLSNETAPFQPAATSLAPSSNEKVCWSNWQCLIVICSIVWPTWGVCMYWLDSWNLFSSKSFMSFTMALGSFIAGATAEGGGAVAFPVMTLIFDINPLIARDFSLIIQSVGMNAAAFTIIATRIKVVWPAIITSGLGGSFGVYFGMTYFSGLLPPGLIKMFFVSFWLGFGFALWISKRFRNRYITIESANSADHALLFIVGIVGGIVSGLTGSGLDVVTFSVLTLYYRICPTVATPTSVILMGNNALMGVILKTSLMNGIMTQAIDYFLVCVPCS